MDFMLRFPLSWVSGEAKVKVNPSNVNLCSRKWESSELILFTKTTLVNGYIDVTYYND